MLISTKRLCKSSLFIFSAFVLPMSVSAEWGGNIEGGSVFGGDTRGTRVGVEVFNRSRPLTHEIELEWVGTSSGTSTYEASYVPRYWFSKNSYVFGEANIRTFEELSFDNTRRAFGGGLGTRLIDTPTQILNLEAGLTQVTFFDVATDVTPEFEDSTLFAGATLDGSQLIYDLVRLEIEGSFLTAEDINQFGAEIGISVRVAQGAIRYRYRYVGIDVEGLDLLSTNTSAISFDYGF